MDHKINMNTALNVFQATLSPKIEQDILNLFALGVEYHRIQHIINERHRFNLTKEQFSVMISKLVPALRKWQQRPLNSLYPFVWFCAFQFKIRKNGRYVNKTAYTVLALNLAGRKENIGLYLSENSDTDFWMSVFIDLQGRGVNDILIVCESGFVGLSEALNCVYSQSKLQLCIICQIHNSLKYIDLKNHQRFMDDLQPIHKATSKAAAEFALNELEIQWGSEYPLIIQSWRRKWDKLMEFLNYPQHIRNVIYSGYSTRFLNPFELSSKENVIYSSESSLLKQLYLKVVETKKKRVRTLKNWNLTLSQLFVHFPDRLDSDITL